MLIGVSTFHGNADKHILLFFLKNKRHIGVFKKRRYVLFFKKKKKRKANNNFFIKIYIPAFLCPKTPVCVRGKEGGKRAPNFAAFLLGVF